ncbi:MAG: sodium:solute symporter family protein [Planctomycetia bacterium]|nr:sodium:solute symporter family protein [Planctomycetia bacterium]
MDKLDIAVIIGYFILVAGIGITMGRTVRNTKDYFTGNRSVRWFMGGISNYMTMISTFIFIAYAGISYQDGLTALAVMWSSCFATILGTLFLARRWKRIPITTPTEFLEKRYNSGVRQTISWGGIVFRLLDNMVRLYAMGLFISAVSGFPLIQGILLTGTVVLVYTMIGGLWAVILTDVIQCVMIVLVSMILVPLVWMKAGGISGLYSAIPDHFCFTNGTKGSLGFLLVYYLMVLLKFNGNWAFIQRFYSTRSESESVKMGLFSALLFLILPVLFLFPAFAAPVIAPNLSNPETAYVAVCKILLPAGTMGLMLAAMFAATMSTLSAEYNVTSSVLTKDIYQRLFRKNAGDRELLITARIATFLIGILIMIGSIFIEKIGGAFEANKILTGLLGVPLVVPLIFGVLFKKPSSASAIASILTGISAGLFFWYTGWFSWEIGTLIQIVSTIAVLFLLGYLLPGTSDYRAKVVRFFEPIKRTISGGSGDVWEISCLKEDIPAAEEEMRSEEKTRILRTNAFIIAVFAGSLVFCSLLFFISGFFNIKDISGQLTAGAGGLCLLFAGIQIWRARKLYKEAK